MQGYVHQKGSIFWAILEAANHREISGKASASAWSHREPWSINYTSEFVQTQGEGTGARGSLLQVWCAPPPPQLLGT